MALTTIANWRAYTGVTIDEASDALVTSMINRASDAIERYCDRLFESDTYRERRDGDGDTDILLKQYPVTAITMVSVGVWDVILITNTSADAFNAYVTVGETDELSTSLVLAVQGGTNDGTNTLAFAARGTYTCATLVTAINAVGSGWSATIQATTQQYWDAVELLPIQGYPCLKQYVYLSVPEEIKGDYQLYPDRGEIYLPSRFTGGHNNVTIRYTAGYSTIPDDLEQICIDLAQIYYHSKDLDMSIKSEKLADHTITVADEGGGDVRDVPSHLRRRLAPWRKWGPR